MGEAGREQQRKGTESPTFRWGKGSGRRISSRGVFILVEVLLIWKKRMRKTRENKKMNLMEGVRRGRRPHETQAGETLIREGAPEMMSARGDDRAATE